MERLVRVLDGLKLVALDQVDVLFRLSSGMIPPIFSQVHSRYNRQAKFSHDG